MKYNLRNIVFKDLPDSEHNNRLGIYLRKNTATVVCLGSQGQDYNVLGCFSVTGQGQDVQNPQEIASLIAQGCSERTLVFSEAAIALDCAMFMQHNVHSEFTDPKQIASTVRFDTEEILATDIADVAIAFRIVSSNQAGSKLNAFTAQRKVLSDILLSLQSNNIDPATIEPDVNCLSRFVDRNMLSFESLQSGTLLGILSQQSGYLVVCPSFAAAQKTPTVRTFLIGPTQNRNELLAREVLMTIASGQLDEPIKCLKAFDSTGSIDYQQLKSKLGMEVSSIDLVGPAGTGHQFLNECNGPVDFAIAYGAALAHQEKTQSINFRNDFMPYQGKKVQMQKALKFASYSVTVLMLAVGLYFQASLWKINRGRSAASRKFAQDYSAVMLGKKLPAKTSPVTKLKSELGRIKDVKRGLISEEGEKSISAKLTLVLQAFNNIAENTDLNIESVTITDRNINIAGDTSSRGNTLRLFEAIKKAGLEIQQQGLYTKESRDNFSITVVPKN